VTPSDIDSSEVSPEPSPPIGTVRDGGYVLEVGGPSGTIVSRQAGSAEPAQGQKPKKDPSEAVEQIVDKASSVTTRVEKADALYEDLADGSVELAQVDSAIDSLVGLLERLDREGKHEDALRVARTLSKLLSLARRWLALLKALQAALRAGEVLGDESAIAWAKHELGTAHLVRGDLAEADRGLGEAQELRKRLGDRRGLAATVRNLEALCGRLRRLLRERELVRRRGRLPRPPTKASPFVLAALALALFAGGGVAGAVLASDSGTEASRTVGSDGNNGGEPGDGGKPGDGGGDDNGGESDGDGRSDGAGGDGDGDGDGRNGGDGEGGNHDGNGGGDDFNSLTVAFAGDGSGTVSIAPSEIEECREECVESLPANKLVTLTADEDEGSAFTGFSPNCEGTDRTCEVRMTRARSVTATFEPREFKLTVTVSEGPGSVTSSPGEIACSIDVEGGRRGKCSDLFQADQEVELTARASNQAPFVRFSGKLTDECAKTSCTIKMDRARSVTVTFTD
jgi:hypothetical protein